ncbi:YHS domain-containing protein [Roseitalea porphyridii]|uniref:YHS domain-containing protein n=1 Tax=Roseitalea porphyridii TaxID=1852022 RepID=A0A4P6V4Y2_9HYPH|nr:YHS domain-containing protein [Roseitalea porphyridii]QBK31874.1 YHS domain-containing protein [Roseitalea porphyridii]
MIVQDPVCGRHLTIDQVFASADHEGWECFFCSAVCAGRFRKQPALFAQAARQTNRKQDA